MGHQQVAQQLALRILQPDAGNGHDLAGLVQKCFRQTRRVRDHLFILFRRRPLDGLARQQEQLTQIRRQDVRLFRELCDDLVQLPGIVGVGDPFIPHHWIHQQEGAALVERLNEMLHLAGLYRVQQKSCDDPVEGRPHFGPILRKGVDHVRVALIFVLRIDGLCRIDSGGQRADLDAHGAEHGNVGHQGAFSESADIVDRCDCFHT